MKLKFFDPQELKRQKRIKDHMANKKVVEAFLFHCMKTGCLRWVDKATKEDEQKIQRYFDQWRENIYEKSQ